MANDEQVGSVAEEAAKLFATINNGGHDEDGEHRNDEGHEGHPSSGPECQWCPVCQLISLARHARPETVEQLASAATGVLGSLRGLIDAATESARAAAQAKADEREHQAPPDKSERIDVSEDPEPWD